MAFVMVSGFLFVAHMAAGAWLFNRLGWPWQYGMCIVSLALVYRDVYIVMLSAIVYELLRGGYGALLLMPLAGVVAVAGVLQYRRSASDKVKNSPNLSMV